MSKNVTRAVLLLCVIGMGGAMPNGVVAPGLTQMAAVLGEGQRGMFLGQMVMTCAALSAAVSAPLVGWLSERIGYGLTMIVGLAGLAIFGCVGFFTESVWILVTSRVIAGIASGAMIIPACALIFYYFEGPTRERVFGLMTAGSATFSMTTSAVAALLVREHGWHAAFLVYAIVFIPLLFAPFIIVDKNGLRSAIKPPPMEKGQPLPWASIGGVLLFAMAMAMLMFNCVVQIPFMLAERGHSDPALVSLVLVVECSLQITAAILFGWFSSRLNMRYMMAMVFCLFGIAHLIVGLAPNLVIMFVGIGVIGFASAFTKPAAASYLLRKLPPAMHGRASGAVITALYLGGFMNPILLTPAAAAMGSFQSFVLLGVLNILGFMIAIAPLRAYRSAQQS